MFFSEMATGIHEMGQMSGTLAHRFEAAFPMATFKKSTWSKHSNLYKLANADDMSRYSAPDGLWKRFTAEVKSRIHDQIKNGAIRKNAKVQVNRARMKAPRVRRDLDWDLGASGMNHGAVKAEFDLERDLECEFCLHDLPTSPSPELLVLRTDIDTAAKQKITKPDRSLAYISSVVAHCMRHKAERTYELQTADRKWPSHVNFANLGSRVEALRSSLLQVWQYPNDNQFFQAVTARIKKVGSGKAFNGLNDFIESDDASVG